MWQVVCKSSGIVVASFIDRQRAVWWVEDNDFDHEGEPMGLYKVQKASKTHQNSV
jgi:hypothetical protein